MYSRWSKKKTSFFIRFWVVEGMMSACLQIQTQTNLNEVAEDDGDGVGSVQEDEDMDGAHLGKKMDK